MHQSVNGNKAEQINVTEQEKPTEKAQAVEDDVLLKDMLLQLERSD